MDRTSNIFVPPLIVFPGQKTLKMPETDPIAGQKNMLLVTKTGISGQGGYQVNLPMLMVEHTMLLLIRENVGYKTMLITPVFDISSFTNPELEFWHTQIAWEGDVNALRVYYKTTDGGSWVLIPGGEYTTEITVWTLELLALPSPSATYQIAFEGTDNGGLSICIDDVTIKECCCDPSNQTEGNFTTTSADLDWTENGSATTWDIKTRC